MKNGVMILLLALLSTVASPAGAQSPEQWVKDNGVRIDVGGPNDSARTMNAGILQLPDGRYRAYYDGHVNIGGTTWILSAVSNDGIVWTKDPGIRLSPGSGAFGYDDTQVTDPSVIILNDGKYWMYYSGITTGIDRRVILRASSIDGLSWTKDLSFKIVGSTGAMTAFHVGGPEIVKTASGFRLYFSNFAGDGSFGQIIAADSPDGLSWGTPAVVLTQTAQTGYLFGPTVRTLSPGTLRMYFSGGRVYSERGMFTDRIYSATSTDAGATWSHDPGPVLDFGAAGEFDYDRLISPSVAEVNGTLRLYYTGRGPLGSSTHRILSARPANSPPAFSLGSAITAVEADVINRLVQITDPDNDSWTISIDYGDGTSETIGPQTGKSFFLNHAYGDNGEFAIVVSVSDGSNVAGPESLPVTVLNAPPVITSVTGPQAPMPAGSSAAITANFTDAGALDTHSCAFVWGDSSGSTTVSASSGSCTAAHTFSAAGVYSVVVTVTDDDGGAASSRFEYVVDYDADAGFVTGGGWMTSPLGAYLADPNLTGKATFGFVSKYAKGATTPTGQTQFNFQAAGFNFHSTVYEWLVVAGHKAQYRGSGQINGAGDYGFILTVIDGDKPSGGGADRLRLKIWDKTSNVVVYDNRRGSPDDLDGADPQVISGGSIVIHDK
jgi:hypothetical protein